MSIYFRFICEQIQFKKLTDFSTIILEDQFSVIFFSLHFIFLNLHFYTNLPPVTIKLRLYLYRVAFYIKQTLIIDIRLREGRIRVN